MNNPTQREPIWVALLGLLQSKLAGSYQVISRTHVQPPQLPPESQPALFLVQGGEAKTPKPGFPGKIMLSGFLIIYFQAPPPLLENTGSETVNGATILNGLLQGIDAALLPDNISTDKLQLGGIVEHCWIEGQTDMDTGIYAQQGAAIIPIKILIP